MEIKFVKGLLGSDFQLLEMISNDYKTCISISCGNDYKTTFNLMALALCNAIVIWCLTRCVTDNSLEVGVFFG